MTVSTTRFAYTSLTTSRRVGRAFKSKGPVIDDKVASVVRYPPTGRSAIRSSRELSEARKKDVKDLLIA